MIRCKTRRMGLGRPWWTSARGFTLLEALVVMAILGVLLSLAVPAMQTLHQQHRLQAQAEGLLDSLLLARSEALRRQQRITVCVRANDSACDPQGTWSQGWLVFADDNHNAHRDPTETVIEVHPALPKPMQLAGNSTVKGYVSYSAEGRSQSVGGAFMAGTLSLCSPSVAQGWQVVVNALGRPRLQKYNPHVCD